MVESWVRITSLLPEDFCVITLLDKWKHICLTIVCGRLTECLHYQHFYRIPRGSVSFGLFTMVQPIVLACLFEIQEI